MSLKIISKKNKTMKVELSINLESENFLGTEELIMDEVNKMGKLLTEEAMKNLEVKENVIVIEGKSHYVKKVKKNIKPLMGK